jgi:predicted nucleotidyltransferase
MLISTFSRKGGKARTPAKTAANRAKAAAFWADVRVGKRPAPRRPCAPPPPEEIARRLAPFCQQHGITQLDLFGSAARGDGRRGSDVDLIATFQTHPGLRIVEIEQGMGRLLGVPVDLLTREAVEDMPNPYRKGPIIRDRRTIYAA